LKKSQIARLQFSCSKKIRPTTAECAGRAGLLCPGNSDVDLFGYGQRIIYIDPEVPNRDFNFSVAE
jgi:hypothetical protein